MWEYMLHFYAEIRRKKTLNVLLMEFVYLVLFAHMPAGGGDSGLCCLSLAVCAALLSSLVNSLWLLIQPGSCFQFSVTFQPSLGKSKRLHPSSLMEAWKENIPSSQPPLSARAHSNAEKMAHLQKKSQLIMEEIHRLKREEKARLRLDTQRKAQLSVSISSTGLRSFLCSLLVVVLSLGMGGGGGDYYDALILFLLDFVEGAMPHAVNAEIKVLFIEDPKPPGVHVCWSGVGQSISYHFLPTTRNSAFVVSTFLVHST